MDLLAAVKAAGTAARFVEGGGLEEALSELNIAAARIALKSADLAATPDAQVRSAVTHLEAAKAAAIARLQKRRLLRSVTRFRQWNIDLDRLSYINGLLAICYRYLGEERLAELSLNLARLPLGTEIELKDAHVWATAAGMFVSLFTAIEEDFINEERHRVNWGAFELPPRGVLPEAPASP